jgi:ketosteroid isomerase-like protein
MPDLSESAVADPDVVAVRQVLDAIARAMHDRDAAAVARYFARDATLADLAPPLRRGVDPDGLQRWLDGWDAPVEVTYRDLSVTVEGRLALCHGLVHTRTARGGEPAAWWARMTTALARSDAGWRIIHDHVSVPFYMDGSDRAAIDLEPET